MKCSMHSKCTFSIFYSWTSCLIHTHVMITALLSLNFRGSDLEGGLKGFENVVKRTSDGAHRSPRRLADTQHPMKPHLAPLCHYENCSLVRHLSIVKPHSCVHAKRVLNLSHWFPTLKGGCIRLYQGSLYRLLSFYECLISTYTCLIAINFAYFT